MKYLVLYQNLPSINNFISSHITKEWFQVSSWKKCIDEYKDQVIDSTTVSNFKEPTQTDKFLIQVKTGVFYKSDWFEKTLTSAKNLIVAVEALNVLTDKQFNEFDFYLLPRKAFVEPNKEIVLKKFKLETIVGDFVVLDKNSQQQIVANKEEKAPMIHLKTIKSSLTEINSDFTDIWINLICIDEPENVSKNFKQVSENVLVQKMYKLQEDKIEEKLLIIHFQVDKAYQDLFNSLIIRMLQTLKKSGCIKHGALLI